MRSCGLFHRTLWTVDSQPSADDVRPLLRQAAAIADLEDDGRWAIIREVHRRTDRTAFDAVCELARSADIHERVVALDVLAQIGYVADRPFLEETLPMLIDAGDDGDADVAAAAGRRHGCHPRRAGGTRR
jgi:hypothetical protein